MNRKLKIIMLTIIIFLIFFVVLVIIKYNKVNSKKENEIEQMKNESIMYKENATLDELKNEYKVTGNNDLYKIETEYDGRKVINVKEDINYKVAFSGMITEKRPNYEDIDELYIEQYPKEQGIWIDKSSRQKIKNSLNRNMETKYDIDNKGYLRILDKSKQNENDRKLEEIMNRKNTYIWTISGEYYMIDPVTGNIVLNPYEDLERYQTYEYVENNEDMIIFITENTEGVLTDEEIFESIVNLIFENN